MNAKVSNISGQIEAVPKEPPFPLNIVALRRYTGLRVISLIVFLVFTYGFFQALYSTTFEKTEIVQSIQGKNDGQGWLKRFGIWAYRKTWQDYPEETKLQTKIDNTVSSIRFWSFIRMIFSWCLVWMCFDWDTAKHFVFATICISFGVIYSLLPIDALPDFIPVGGMLDDLTINIFGSGLGIASVLEYYRKKKQKALVARLISQHPEAAINVALEDYDLTMDKLTNQAGEQPLSPR